MSPTLRENGATVVSMAAISSTVLLLGHAVTAMLSLEVKLLCVSLAWGGLYLLQRVLVGKRRCSNHWLVKYGTMAAYYLPDTLVLYAANAVYTTSHQFSDGFTRFFALSGVLAMLFCATYCSTRMLKIFTNMRDYSLRDRPRSGYNFLMCLVLLDFLVWARNPSPNSSALAPLIAYMTLSFFASLSILFGNTSQSTLDCQTKAVADYIKQLKSRKSSTGSPSPFFDDDANTSLQPDCCRYPFVQGEYGKWVTVKDLFHHCRDLPTSDKDICLSYSLSRLLARRYYGFQCAEEGDDKVRRFALAGLGTAEGYKRPFRIAEVQLAFLHDYFFTSSLEIITHLGHAHQIIQYTFLLLTIIITLFYQVTLILIRYDQSVFSTIRWSVLMVPFMYISWCGLVSERPMMVPNVLASYWRPIHTAFRKLNCLSEGSTPTKIGFRSLYRAILNLNEQEVLIDSFQTQTDVSAYWRNKIGQYSILQDYDRRLSHKKALEDRFNRSMLSQPSYRFIKHLPVEEEEVDMLKLDSMIELVADTLRAIDGPPTNGTRSLKINMDSSGYDWSWTCRQETHTHTILIWHIATCYCDMTPISDDILVKWYHEAARAMSRYCAYLAAFLPEFLPEHNLTTKQVFQRVLQEAQGALGREPLKEEEKRIKMAVLQLPNQHQQWTTFYMGVHLGRQLEMLSDDSLRWKVMAEFWAETILYIAPSDNAEAHIEHLAEGGEFITHLWAMLSNAGILKRAEGEWHPPPVVTATEEEPPTHQELEAMSSSNDGPSTSSRPSPPIQTSEPPPNEEGKQLQMMEDID